MERNAHTEYLVYKKQVMKKITSILLVFVMLLLPLMLLSCKTAGNGEKEENSEVVYYTVTFNSNGGSEISPQKVTAGSKLKEPAAPIYENYIFSEWTHNGKTWDFNSDTVKGDMTLTAQWISADSLFKYSPIENTDAAEITGFKDGYNALPVNVVFPETINGLRVTAVGDGAFKDLSANDVASITLHKNIVSIGKSAFDNCVNIEINVKGSLIYVGESAFGNCNKLTSVTFGEGIERIEPEAFLGSGIKRIMLPKSLKLICEDAFSDCASLSVIVIYPIEADGSEQFVIQNSAFRDCDALKTVFFFGNENELKALLEHTDTSSNSIFVNVKKSLYSETEPTEDGSFWRMVDGEPREW